MEHHVCGLFWFWKSCSMACKYCLCVCFSVGKENVSVWCSKQFLLHSTSVQENPSHGFPQHFEPGTKDHLLSVAQAVSSFLNSLHL